MRHPRIRITLALAAAACLPLIAASTALASASQHPGRPHTAAVPARDEGPFYIRAENGHQYFAGADTVAAGFAVIQESGHGRFLYFTFTGNDPNANVEGRIHFSNGTFMAANNACSGVTIKSGSGSNGVIWIEVDAGGHFYLINRYCDHNNAYTERMGGNNILGDQWGIGDAGLYTALIEVPV